MANFNTFTGFRGGTLRNQIPLQTLASTTETAFTINTDNGSGAAAILAVPAGGGIAGSVTPFDQNVNAALSQQNSSLQLSRGVARPEFSSSSFNGYPFKIRLFGTGAAVTGSGNTLTLRLYQGTSSSVIGTSGNRVAATSAVAAATTGPLNFLMEATVMWDSTTGSVSGYYIYVVNYGGTTTPATPTTATLTNNVAVTSIANMQFLASAQWGNSAGGTIQVNEFSLERL